MRLTTVFLSLLLVSPAAAQVTLTQGTNFSVDVASDGRIVIDLLGSIWVVPKSGGAATAIAAVELPASRPQWSPGADSIIFQVDADGQEQIWQYSFASQGARNIAGEEYSNRYATWHPGGERIVFSSQRRGSGFDLWELDLATGLSWRISHADGDELEAAWSADGRDLAYVHRQAGTWSIMLRQLGEPDRVLVSSDTRLSAPSWRPDGSLITFLRHAEGALSIDMIILSDPPLVRPLISGEDFFETPVSWINRQQLVYAANGVIRKRDFNSWSSSNVPFRATVSSAASSVSIKSPARELPLIETPTGDLVLRTARLFDGIGGGYQDGIDVVIKGGKITALEPRRERPGEIIVDLGNVTALPGYIDSYAMLPASVGDALGALLLSFGITTIVAEHDSAEALDQAWSGKETPGPRVLRAGSITKAQATDPWLLTLRGDLAAGIARRDTVAAWMSRGVPVVATSWQAAIGSGANMILGANSLPASPGGQRYADINLGSGSTPVTIISGLADQGTPGISNLLRVRQAALLPPAANSRRYSDAHDLAANAADVLLGSKPNGLPAGIALHAEFLALAAAGLSGEQLLRAAGVNPALALGLGLQVGRLAPGSMADVVIVDGDPLRNPADFVKVVGVVRNGRFYSAIGLIERARRALDVE